MLPPDAIEAVEFIKKNLKLRLQRPHFTSPNERIIELVLDGEVIDAVHFDVVQQREYEG